MQTKQCSNKTMFKQKRTNKTAEAYSEPNRTSAKKHFQKIANGLSRKLFLQKKSIVDVPLSSKYTSEQRSMYRVVFAVILNVL